jgi:hypothetical protein
VKENETGGVTNRKYGYIIFWLKPIQLFNSLPPAKAGVN